MQRVAISPGGSKQHRERATYCDTYCDTNPQFYLKKINKNNTLSEVLIPANGTIAFPHKRLIFRFKLGGLIASLASDCDFASQIVVLADGRDERAKGAILVAAPPS